MTGGWKLRVLAVSQKLQYRKRHLSCVACEKKQGGGGLVESIGLKIAQVACLKPCSERKSLIGYPTVFSDAFK